MKDTGKNRLKSNNLRKRAEAFLQKTPSTIKKMSGKDIKDLIEELQIHQVELEIQGEELRRSQLELEETRDRYLDLYDFAPVGYVTLSEKGIILEANLAVTTLLGVERLRLLRMPFSQFVIKEDKDIFYFHKKKILETRDRDTCELRLVKKDGRQFYVKLDSIVLLNSAEDVNEFRISIGDIGEQKKAADALAVSEKQKALILDSTIARITFCDKHLEVKWANRAAGESVGLAATDLVGRHCYEIWQQRDSPCKECPVQDAIETGQPKEGEIITPDGTCWFLRAYPAFDENGELLGITEVGHDITGQKSAEMALKESNERFELAMHFSNDGLFDWNLETNQVYYSPGWKRLLGYEENEIKNEFSEWERFTKPEDVKATWVMINELLERKRDHFTKEFQMLHKDGHWVDILSRANVVFDKNGKAIRLVGTHVDITERKRAEKALTQSQKMESIGNLAGGIAHDFNNILSAVIGYTELSLDDVERSSNMEGNLQEVLTAGKRAKDLVKQILTFARQSDDERKPIQVDIILKEVLNFLRSSIPTTVVIKRNIKSDSLIMGNATQVHQVLMNLCINASQAMEVEGGILEVRLKDIQIERTSSIPELNLKPGNYIRIMVSDTGVGIPPEIITSIFDPYFTTKNPGEGTGMGLATAHGIVETYGGRITADSTLGKGTLFTIYLPVIKKREEHLPYQSEELATGTERILFVDDEASIANMGRQVLSRLGYSVSTRTSSVEALELFRAKPEEFDLIITDMTMPNMTGDQLTVKLLEIRPDIPVILCTGYSKKISDESAVDMGIKAFVYKPVVKADLAKTVRRVLDETKDE